MEEYHIISDFCLIRNNRLILNGEELYRGSEDTPAAFLMAAYRQMNISYAKFFKMDNLCKLGFLASEIMLRNKHIGLTYAGDEVGLLLTNAGSSIDADRNHQHSIIDRSQYFPSPSVFVYTLANIVIGEICIRHKLSGESLFLIEEKFNPERIYGLVRSWFDDQIVRSCLTGWVEMDGDSYEAVLYFIEKSTGYQQGIAIFDPGKLNDIYLQRN
jgi:hypothetical protein